MTLQAATARAKSGDGERERWWFRRDIQPLFTSYEEGKEEGGFAHKDSYKLSAGEGEGSVAILFKAEVKRLPTENIFAKKSLQSVFNLCRIFIDACFA